MKKRLFAAAMAMTMVMASSIPAMADPISISPSEGGTNKNSADIGINAIVTNQPRETGVTSQAAGDKERNIWSVTIGADQLTYNIVKTTTTNYIGVWDYEWDPVNHNYRDRNNRTVDGTTTSYDFSGETLSELEGHVGQAVKTFSIKNDSNFPLASATSTFTSTQTGVLETAITTDTGVENLATNSSTTTSVYMDKNGITDSYTNYTSGEAQQVGTLRISLTAGEIY